MAVKLIKKYQNGNKITQDEIDRSSESKTSISPSTYRTPEVRDYNQGDYDAQTTYNAINDMGTAAMTMGTQFRLPTQEEKELSRSGWKGKAQNLMTGTTIGLANETFFPLALKGFAKGVSAVEGLPQSWQTLVEAAKNKDFSKYNPWAYKIDPNKGYTNVGLEKAKRIMDNGLLYRGTKKGEVKQFFPIVQEAGTPKYKGVSEKDIYHSYPIDSNTPVTITFGSRNAGVTRAGMSYPGSVGKSMPTTVGELQNGAFSKYIKKRPNMVGGRVHGSKSNVKYTINGQVYDEIPSSINEFQMGQQGADIPFQIGKQPDFSRFGVSNEYMLEADPNKLPMTRQPFKNFPFKPNRKLQPGGWAIPLQSVTEGKFSTLGEGTRLLRKDPIWGYKEITDPDKLTSNFTFTDNLSKGILKTENAFQKIGNSNLLANINFGGVKLDPSKYYTSGVLNREMLDQIDLDKTLPNNYNNFRLGFNGVKKNKFMLGIDMIPGFTDSPTLGNIMDQRSNITGGPVILDQFMRPSLYKKKFLMGYEKLPFHGYQEGMQLTKGIGEHYKALNNYVEGQVPGLKVYGSAKLAEKGLGNKYPGDIDSFLLSNEGETQQSITDRLTKLDPQNIHPGYNPGTFKMSLPGLNTELDVTKFRTDKVGPIESQLMYYRNPKDYQVLKGLNKTNGKFRGLNAGNGKLMNELTSRNIEAYNNNDFVETSLLDMFSSTKSKHLEKATDMEDMLRSGETQKVYDKLISSSFGNKIKLPPIEYFSNSDKNQELLASMEKVNRGVLYTGNKRMGLSPLAKDPEATKLAYTKFLLNEGTFGREVKANNTEQAVEYTTNIPRNPTGGEAYGRGLYNSKGIASAGGGQSRYYGINSPYDLNKNPHELVKEIVESKIGYDLPLDLTRNSKYMDFIRKNKDLQKALTNNKAIKPRDLYLALDSKHRYNSWDHSKDVNANQYYHKILNDLGYKVIENSPGSNYVVTGPSKSLSIDYVPTSDAVKTHLGFLSSVDNRMRDVGSSYGSDYTRNTYYDPITGKFSRSKTKDFMHDFSSEILAGSIIGGGGLLAITGMTNADRISKWLAPKQDISSFNKDLVSDYMHERQRNNRKERFNLIDKGIKSRRINKDSLDNEVRNRMRLEGWDVTGNYKENPEFTKEVDKQYTERSKLKYPEPHWWESKSGQRNKLFQQIQKEVREKGIKEYVDDQNLKTKP
jgi:hypothetical protein